jgi:dCTP deaminase
MSILVDHEIRHYCRTEIDKMISPFNEEQLQPSSYDVKLGNVFLYVSRSGLSVVDLSDPSTFSDLYERFDIPDGVPFLLPPKGCMLGCTKEIVNIPSDIVSRIQGKSSIGRTFQIIETAGYIDPGFNGSVTMEIHNLLNRSVRYWPGMTIAQLSFEFTSAKPENTYNGRYQGDLETVGSRYTG